MDRRLAIACAAVAVLSATVHGQRGSEPDRPETLTNDTILQLVIAKAPTPVIVSRIRSADNRFDVTPEDLVRLYQRGMPVDLISLILRSASRPSDTLTNQSVIYMVTSTLPRAIVIEKIQRSRGAYDLTAAGLIALGEAKVPAAVVSAMRGASPSKAGVTVPPAEVAPITVSAATVAPSVVQNVTVQPTTIPGGNSTAEAGTSVSKTVPPSTVSPAAAAAMMAEPVTVANPTLADSGPARTGVAPPAVADGEPAVFRVRLTASAALERVEEYFAVQRIGARISRDRNGLLSAPFNERRCGRLQCANVADVRVTLENTEAVVVVQVFERTRDGGPSRPWKDDARSKGRETSTLAAALAAAMK